MDPPYSVEAQPAVLKEMRRLPRAEQTRLLDRMGALGVDPRPAGCEKLAEHSGAYRVRIGRYRIIYRVDDVARVVEIVRVGDRGSVYRRR